MLQGSLEPWQKSVIMFNLGCAFLANEQWEDALEIFKAVPIDNKLAPLLQYRIQYNIAVTTYKQGLQLFQAGDDYAQAATLFRKVLEDISVIHSHACAYQEVLGMTSCIPSQDVENLKNMSLHYLVKALQQEEKERIPSLSLYDGLSLLLSESEWMISIINLLEHNSTQDLLKERYLKLQMNDEKPLISLWDLLSKKVEQEKIQNIPKAMELFHMANEHFAKGFGQIKKKDFDSSRQSFESAETTIRTLIALLPPPPEKTPETQPQKEQQESTTSETKPIEQVLQNLLEMERDDMMPVPNQPLKKQELRPW